MGNEFGENLEKALKEKNMTQKRLAEEAGVTEAAVSHYVKGDREPHKSTLNTIAAVLGITAASLLGYGVGVGTATNKMQKFNEIKKLIEENKANFSAEERMELVKLLSI